MKTEEKELMDNIRIVGAQANCFAPNNVCDREDYMQTGLKSLLKAMRGLDKTKGKLTTYSWPIIYRDIKKEQAEKFKNIAPITYDIPVTPKTCIWELIPSNLSEQENTIIKLKLESYNIRQIARKMGIKCKEAHEIFGSACQKIREANLDA